MKNLIYSFIFVVVIAGINSSCTVTKTTTSKTFDIYGAGVVQTPVLVDLEVEEIKVSGTATRPSSTGFEMIKQEAVARALEKVNADVLVEPTFKTKTANGQTTADVTGFPATYKNFRTIQEKDIKLLEAGVIQKAEVYEPKSDTAKKGGGKTAAIILVAAAAVAAILFAIF
jgi:hypothetical protein